MKCGLVRDRGIDLTSITRPMPDSRNRSTNSTIVLVEWPMVKKVFVLSLQWRKAHDEPASPLILSAGFQNQKCANCWKNPTIFEEPIGSAAIGMLMPLK